MEIQILFAASRGRAPLAVSALLPHRKAASTGSVLTELTFGLGEDVKSDLAIGFEALVGQKPMEQAKGVSEPSSLVPSSSDGSRRDGWETPRP